MMHCQHISDYYIWLIRRGKFETIRQERAAAGLHYDYTLASRDATFAALFFRY